MFLIAVTIVVVFFSGSYPGLMLSGFKPITALKENYHKKILVDFR